MVGFLTASPPALQYNLGGSGMFTLAEAESAMRQGKWPGAGNWVDDVFSTYLYTGNGSTQTITNGIDLAGKGGLVWIKGRNSAAPEYHWLADTARGTGKIIRTDSTNAQVTSASSITAFNSNGFGIGAETGINTSASINYASWTFRKAPKFFDVVTYTGNGNAQTLNHSLGVAPGLIIVKSTSTGGTSDYNWAVYHRSLGATKGLYLNLTNAAATETFFWNNTEPTATQFTVGNGTFTSANGVSYVAYLFAHDTGADGIIQCGSFTTDGSGNATVTLGWEPQFVITKASSTTGSWKTADSMRGMLVDGSNQQLFPNLANAEAASTTVAPTATGFTTVNAGNSSTFIYLAIRRPNKPPTSGTEVFSSTSAVTTTQNAIITSGFPVDLVIGKAKNATNPPQWCSRLLGGSFLLSSATAAESAWPYVFFDSNTGYRVNASGTYLNGSDTCNWFFRRAPGVFDVVCDTGTGSAHTINHSLGVVPELIIRKHRNGADSWAVYEPIHKGAGALFLESTAGYGGGSSAYWNSTDATASVFTVGTTSEVNANNGTYVTYLFATKPGISKVGSYTGNGGTAGTNGTSQTINCGFTAGARFVLIKRTDSTGDWFVFDTARGLVAGNDPYLLLNSTAAEVTTVDAVDPDNSGFVVNQTSGTNLNVTNATYIYLSFS